jgi:hypothetical protein
MMRCPALFFLAHAFRMFRVSLFYFLKVLLLKNKNGRKAARWAKKKE